MRKLTLAVTADLHCGSTIGLCPPSVKLDDSGEYWASRPQLWLWNNWRDYIERVKAKAVGGDLYTIIAGDAIDGDHHDTSQIITRNMTSQCAVAAEVIEPIANISDRLFFIRGTEAHVGRSAQHEEALAGDFDNTISDGERATWWHLVADFRGVKFDVAHHGGGVGRKPWTRGNAAGALAAETCWLYAERGERPPDYVIRAHSHRFSDSGENYPCRALNCGAWQLATAFSNKIQPGALADFVSFIFVIEGGRADVEIVRYRPTRREVYVDRG